MSDTNETAVIMDEMRNCRTLSLAYSEPVDANDIIVNEGRVLVAVIGTREADQEIGYVYFGKVQFPKLAGAAFLPGDNCYWDPVALNITKVATNNILCGICLQTQLAANTSIVMMLNPFMALPYMALSYAQTFYNAINTLLGVALTVGQMAAALFTVLARGGAQAAAWTDTLPSAAAIIAAFPGWAIGSSFVLRVINQNTGGAGGPYVMTFGSGAEAGITYSGTRTIAAATWRDFLITMTGAATVSVQSIGTGAQS